MKLLNISTVFMIKLTDIKYKKSKNEKRRDT